MEVGVTQKSEVIVPHLEWGKLKEFNKSFVTKKTDDSVVVDLGLTGVTGDSDLGQPVSEQESV